MVGGIDVEITIREDVTAAIARLVAAGGDMTPVMGDIAGHLADTTRERFETSTSPDGVPWIRSRRVLGLDGSKKGFGPHQASGLTLVLTGDLSNSIIEGWGKDFAEAGPEKSGGAGVYAAAHQFGLSDTVQVKASKRTVDTLFGKALDKAITFEIPAHSRKVNLPARPYVGFSDINADYAVGAIGDHLLSAFAQGPAA